MPNLYPISAEIESSGFDVAIKLLWLQSNDLQKPWSSGYGRRLMSNRLWFQIQAPDTRQTIIQMYLL